MGGYTKEKITVGMTKITTEGCKIEVIKVTDSHNITVKFEKSGFEKNTTMHYFRIGKLKNPYHCSVYNVGYLGYGEYTSVKNPKAHSLWNSMLSRCYSESYQKRQPTYVGCSVDERWHNFQVFAEWYYKNWKPWMDTAWALDKDILIKGSKTYSPETCAFVPREINNLLYKPSVSKELPVGVCKMKNKYIISMYGIKTSDKKRHTTPESALLEYKELKEKRVKEVAITWKNKIDLRVYNKLINFKIEEN